LGDVAAANRRIEQIARSRGGGLRGNTDNGQGETQRHNAGFHEHGRSSADDYKDLRMSWTPFFRRPYRFIIGRDQLDYPLSGCNDHLLCGERVLPSNFFAEPRGISRGITVGVVVEVRVDGKALSQAIR